MAAILIVDDNADVSESLTVLLECEGHAVRCAASGEQAVRLLLLDGAPVPDLLLLDVSVSGGDGLELLRRVRRDARTASLPVVVFSAAADPGVLREAARHGARDVLRKGALPFGRIRARLAAYLG